MVVNRFLCILNHYDKVFLNMSRQLKPIGIVQAIRHFLIVVNDRFPIETKQKHVGKFNQK